VWESASSPPSPVRLPGDGDSGDVIRRGNSLC
jgi:hypothetical protein